MTGFKAIVEYVIPLSCLYVLVTIVQPTLIHPENYVLNHALVQTALFFVIGHIPCFLTGVMWWVDVAWPFGLCAIAVYNYKMSQSDTSKPSYKAELISFCYLFQGGRMALGAVYLVATKRWRTDTEIGRYIYQKTRYEQQNPGYKWGMMNLQKEIFMQAYANYGILLLPGALVCNNRNPMTPLEIFGFALWVSSYLFESIADNQKLAFIVGKAKAKEKNAVCNVGLWKYSRHPNYFGEWMVWNSLIIISLPSLFSLKISFTQQLMVLGVLLNLSILMFYCLVIWTGTKPAEAGSVVKRPGYKKYQETTSMFFPWFPNTDKNGPIMNLQDFLINL